MPIRLRLVALIAAACLNACGGGGGGGGGGPPVPTFTIGGTVSGLSGAGLVLLVAFCQWRGQGYRRGVGPGLVAGFVPLLLPILAQGTEHVCASGGCLLFPTVCGVGGLLGGITLGMLAPRPRDGRAIPFVTACLIAGVAGSVGCLLYGLVGLGVMIAGLLAGATPVLAARRA